MRIRSTKSSKDENFEYTEMDTFHKAIWPVLICAQCFAIMPVIGVSNYNPNTTKFTFRSLKFVLTFMFLVCGTILSVAFSRNLMEIGINAKNVVGVVFFSCGLASCTMFLFLAKRWPILIRDWSQIELIFLRFPYESPKWKLSNRVRVAASVVLLLSIVEHGMYLLSSIQSYRSNFELCNNNTEKKPNFEDFIGNNYNFVFKNVPYNFGLSLFVLVLNGMFTFIWNFMDLFIMIISLGLAIRFEQLNVRIKNMVLQQTIEADWTTIREHFVLLCELLEMVDENLSAIILLSCMNNLYFICYQLLNIFNKLRLMINYLYFWYSLLYLIGRTVFVFLMAAEIHDKSTSALPDLRGVPSTVWCTEIERLCYQMTTQCISLSGMKFYFMTRKLLFGMAGTIVTYELVLLQFDATNRSKVSPPLCNV